jgi:hypothetical protein
MLGHRRITQQFLQKWKVALTPQLIRTAFWSNRSLCCLLPVVMPNSFSVASQHSRERCHQGLSGSISSFRFTFLHLIARKAIWYGGSFKRRNDTLIPEGYHFPFFTILSFVKA